MPFGRKKSLTDRAHDYVDQIADQFTDKVLPQLEHAWEQAADKAGPVISDARDKAAPLVEEARTRATEAASAGAATAAEKAAEARDKAAPLLAEYRSTAAERASAVASTAATVAAERAAEGRDLATAKVNELRGIEPEPKGGKLKKFLLVGALLAIGGAVFSKLRAKQDDAWQSTYVPPAPPAPKPATPPSPAAPAAGAAPTADDVVTADPPAVDDAGGGAPGEAISDSVEEAHEATTPDEPAEVIDIDDVPQKK